MNINSMSSGFNCMYSEKSKITFTPIVQEASDSLKETIVSFAKEGAANAVYRGDF